MISAARSSSPSPSPQPSGRRSTGPCMGSDYDRTRALEVIPAIPPDGQVGVILSTDGVAGDSHSKCSHLHWVKQHMNLATRYYIDVVLEVSSVANLLAYPP